MNGKEENSGYDYDKEGQMIARRQSMVADTDIFEKCGNADFK